MLSAERSTRRHTLSIFDFRLAFIFMAPEDFPQEPLLLNSSNLAIALRLMACSMSFLNLSSSSGWRQQWYIKARFSITACVPLSLDASRCSVEIATTRSGGKHFAARLGTWKFSHAMVATVTKHCDDLPSVASITESIIEQMFPLHFVYASSTSWVSSSEPWKEN